MRSNFVQSVCHGALILVAVAAATPAIAEGMSREIARQKIVDQCVYSEWKDEKKRETAANRCICAAKRFVKVMSDEEFAAYAKRGKMGSIHAEKWSAAMDACD
ncbi:MAG: hypothetical protein KDJ16_15210 [Hyphomicrobiales bacterium]|nr:hypothetical protein [Hyphomicrobiales bacterium]